ncbi:MAG TPA: hypothetical protein VJ180_12210, partial [Pyrinomonadaceae bacterium]|nr:hypothetical protein [Pyrinomonadaceae bacterium]
MLGLEHTDEQRRTARRIIERGLSVRETEALVRRLAEGTKNRRVRAQGTSATDANVRAAEDKLRRRLAT